MSSQEMVESILNLLKESNNEITVTFPIKNPTYQVFKDCLHDAKTRSILIKDHEVVVDPKYNEKQEVVSVTIRKVGFRSGKTVDGAVFDESKLTKHTYHLPPFHGQIKKLLLDIVPHNVWIHGPTGSGKTQYVHALAREMGMELYKKPITIYQVNGRQDMDSSGFLGSKTIEIDALSKNNHIVFKDGPVVKAMQHGLDKNGQPIKGEAPAILFIDEAAALPSHIMIVLNRVLETCVKERRISLDDDGGREVLSHPQFRIICSANTIGRGSTSNSEVLYTAQTDALDISTLNRFSATFRFGYNKEAEKKILMEKIPDSRIVNQVCKIRDSIRSSIKEGKISSPFTTRDIVGIADLYRVWGSLSDALYYGVMCRLPKDEMIIYNELATAVTGIDFLKSKNSTDVFDYMD